MTGAKPPGAESGGAAPPDGPEEPIGTGESGRLAQARDYRLGTYQRFPLGEDQFPFPSRRCRNDE